MGREGVATIRLINHSPSPIAGVRRARGWIPGDRRFGDPLSTTSSYRQIEAVGRRLGLRAEEHGALREAGFGALQVWQWLLEVSGRGRDERLLTIVFTDLVDFSSGPSMRAIATPHAFVPPPGLTSPERRSSATPVDCHAPAGLTGHDPRGRLASA